MYRSEALLGGELAFVQQRKGAHLEFVDSPEIHLCRAIVDDLNGQGAV